MNTQDREISICIFCDEPVYRDQRKFNLGLDRPVRIDLLTHRACYDEHKRDLATFLSVNLSSYLKKYYEEKVDGKTKKTSSNSKRKIPRHY